MIENSECVVCGGGVLRKKSGTFDSEVTNSKGMTYVVPVHNLSWLECDGCGETFFDSDATEAISEAHRARASLLTAQELKDLRERWRKTQREMSQLLGIGEKTYCRWESGTHFQSEAFDRYIRVLMFCDSNLELLELIAKKKEDDDQNELQRLKQKFPYLPSPGSLRGYGEQFAIALSQGIFAKQE